MDVAALREWAGIGKDLAVRILELATTGDCAVRQELLQSYPVTLLDVLALQGVGPKTAGRLYQELGVTSLPELEAAARAGRIRGLKGMGAKKEALVLQALDERQQHSGRHLLPDASQAVQAVIAWMLAQQPGLDIAPVGSLRRGAETCGDVDLLAVGADPSVLTLFTTYPLVERVLGRGETKASVLLRGGLQADLRAVAAHERGAALQYFTGSKAHNIVLRDRALERGWRLNEYWAVPGQGRSEDCRRDRRGDLSGPGPGVGAAGAAREPRRDRSRRGRHAAAAADGRRSPRRRAHAHHRDRRPQHARGDGGGGGGDGARVHRDHRSQQGARDGQRPRRDPRPGARRAGPRA